MVVTKKKKKKKKKGKNCKFKQNAKFCGIIYKINCAFVDHGTQQT
jgi:hypothetical protein